MHFKIHLWNIFIIHSLNIIMQFHFGTRLTVTITLKYEAVLIISQKWTLTARTHLQLKTSPISNIPNLKPE